MYQGDKEEVNFDLAICDTLEEANERFVELNKHYSPHIYIKYPSDHEENQNS